MSRFIQLHLLTSYPPSNLNRDDLGRPKSALVGGVQRLRISSQALKRAWRTSAAFESVFGKLGEQNLGIRTKRVGVEWIYPRLVELGVAEETARQWSNNIQPAYGDPDDGSASGLANNQLVMLTPPERKKLADFIEQLAINLSGKGSTDDVKAALKAKEKRDKGSDKKKAKTTYARELGQILLLRPDTAVDVALFGRMLAANPAFNVEAAAQVAHAITVHKAAIEDDYFTAVDDLNTGDEDRGAGHIGETGFGAGVYYLYVCINRALLDENLGGDTALRNRALAALLEAMSKTAPTGKQNSFASRAYASCVMAERGDRQPRSLAAAFLRPVRSRDDQDTTASAIQALLEKRESFDAMYETTSDAWQAAAEGEYWPLFPEGRAGSLAKLIDFVQQD